MNISCEVIRDLLPLYAEDMVSPETEAMVKDHLAECPSCAKMLEEMRAPLEDAPKLDSGDLWKFRKRVIQWLIAGLMAAVFFAITLVAWGGALLLRREMIPLENAVVSITEEENAVVVELTPVAAENFTWCSSEDAPDGTRQHYIMASKPVSDWLFRHANSGETVKVTMGMASSVWYYDQGELVCIYGDEEPVMADWGKDPVLVPVLVFGVVVALMAVIMRQKWLRYTAVMSFAFLLAERFISDGNWTIFQNSELFSVIILLVLAGLLTGCVAIVWEFISGAASRDL